VVVIESRSLLELVLKAALAGAGELEFVSGHKLDRDSTRQRGSITWLSRLGRTDMRRG
jgi:hypothetical protein